MNDNRETKNNKQIRSRSAYGFAIAEILAALAMTGVLLGFGFLGTVFVGPGVGVSPANSSNNPFASQAQLVMQSTSSNTPSISSSESGFVNLIQNRLDTMAADDSRSQSGRSNQGGSSGNGGGATSSSSQNEGAASGSASDESASGSYGASERSSSSGSAQSSSSAASNAQDAESSDDDSYLGGYSSSSSGSESKPTSSASESDPGDADEDEAVDASTKVLKQTLKGVDGSKYTVVVRYGEQAGIPEGSTLELVEVNRELTAKQKKLEENKDRPYDTEVFMSKADLDDRASVLAKNLDLGDDGRLLSTKLLYVTVKDQNGKALTPAAPVDVTLTTDAVAPEQSAAIEVAEFVHDVKIAEDEEAVKNGFVAVDGKTAKALEVEDLTGVKDPKTDKSAADRKVSKVKFQASELGEFALATVAEKKAELLNENGAIASVLGPRSVDVIVDPSQTIEAPEGTEPVSAHAFRVDPDPERDTDLWIEATAAAKTSEYVYAGYLVDEGELSDQLFGKDGTAKPVAFDAADAVEFVRSEADSASAVIALPQTPPAAEQADADSADASETLKESITVSGRTYEVTVRYGEETGIPTEGVHLVASQLPAASEDCKQYVERSAEILGADARDLSAAAFDISIVDNNLREIQPAAGTTVDVSIVLRDDAFGAEAADQPESQVVHFNDNGDGEVVDATTTVKGADREVEFSSNGFSVYVVVFASAEKSYAWDVDGSGSISMNSLLGELEIEGTPTHVTVEPSDEALKVDDDADLSLISSQPFNEERNVNVALEGVPGESAEISANSYDKIVTVKANDLTRTYGDGKPELTATVSGLAEGDPMPVFECYCVYKQGDHSGNYPIAPRGETVQNGYYVEYETGTLTVNPKLVTVTAEDKSKTYGEVDPDLTATVEGLVGEDKIDYSLSRSEGENVGEYVITPTGDAEHHDYIINYVPGKFTINPKTVTVKADDKAKDYGEEDPELTATVEGLEDDDTVTYALSREEGEKAGEYVITATGDTEQGNYNVVYESGKFTVTQKSLTITASSETKTYDGYALSSDGYTATDLVEGDAIQSLDHEGELTNVGEISHMVRNAKIVNSSGDEVQACYAINYVRGTLKVTKKPLAITADSAEKIYDGVALVAEGYTSTGLADGDVFESVQVTGSQIQVGTSSNEASGARIVRPTDGAIEDVNDNYDISYEPGTLKVTKRQLTITADSDVKVYDGAALTKETYTVEGLAEGDKVRSVTVTGSQTDAGTSSNVPKNAKIENSNGDDVTDYYDITYVNGTLEVTKKNVKLTAASGLQVYDGTEKTVNGFTVSADGKSLSGISFAQSVSATGSGTEIGSYSVTFTGVTLNETTDTTGNYVVDETEDGTLLITKNAPIKKSLDAFNGNQASYKIEVNPDSKQLNGGQTLVLKDTFTTNQSIDYSSIKATGGSVTYDFSGWTGTYTIPDSTHITITYNTRVSGAAGTTKTFNNTAELGVVQNGSFASWYSDTVDETKTLTPTGSDIEGTGGNYTIRLFTYPQDHMEQGLGGAVFRLLDSNQRPIVYRAGAQTGEVVTFTTGSDGYVNVALDDGIISLHKNTVYYLEMITAPVAHNADDSYTYYQKDNTLYRFLITDDPSYAGDYNYFNGDTLKVRCYPEAAGINVTKRFAGNYGLTDEQKNQIRFKLQKEDMATGDWVDVESHTYAEFTYGFMNFNTGRAGGPALEQAVMYRVIEETPDIEGIDQSGTVTLSYQRDNQPIQENTNEFQVDPDHSTYSFSLVFENTYVDHKLTLVKMNELTGNLLSGAKYTVKKAQGDTEVKTYTTDGDGTIDIRFKDEGANYAHGTAYYAVETEAPTGYLLPHDPEKYYFYFSGNGSGVPEGLPSGTTAVDLTSSYDKVTIDNQTEKVDVPVTVTWNVDGDKSWPATVASVTVSLYQSVNNGDPVPVTHGGNPMKVTLDSGKTFDNTTFVNLPARDGDGNDITYSVKQNELPEYYTSYKVSGTGWYVVSNESAVSVTVKKEWYDLNGNPVTDASDKLPVSFDLYRTTEDRSISTRADLETILRGEEPVQTGLTLSAETNWTNDVTSLQKYNANGRPYYYFALEREDSMPRNNEDSYAITPASGGDPRTLTIKNTQTPITVIVKAEDLQKEYGHEDPDFAFTTEVQDDACTVSNPVKGADGTYTVTVTKGTETKQITFTCSRVEGEEVGSYAINLNGSESQEGYRVRLDDGTLTIMPAQVTVKGTATKVYGDPDPSLVDITGVKEGDTIAYYAYRDVGEQKGSYRITVTGLPKQGNYEITYINDYLTIKPAPVTVTADNVSKAYGQADPELTVTIDGLKSNDAKSVIKYTISRDKQGTAEGESVGEYPITVTGDEEQGNYTVKFVGGTFTITGKKVTVRADNLRKTYGQADPELTAKVEGLLPGETPDLHYNLTRQEGEDVGTYKITATGETSQGYYEVVYEDGLLTIDRAQLTITPVNIIKALTDPITPDPQLTVTFDKLVNHDDEIVPTAVYDSGVWTYTYTREGETTPQFAFKINRSPGETVGSYIIAASPFGERAKNYNITYKTGIFTILTTYNVMLNQQTRDFVDYSNNPEYTYTAELDLSSIGIDSYTADDFVDSNMEFTLPAEDGNSSKILPIPSGAKLTVTQETENPDYTTSITLDTQPIEGTSVEINPVNKASSIVVTHERITLPVQARAAKRQTPEGQADEKGATPVSPLAYLGIPRNADKNPIPQSAGGEDGFIAELDSQGIYNLPEDKYYVAEHASVYNGEDQVAQNVQAIRYDTENKVWQYRLNGLDFTSFADGDQLVLFYMPQYICRVQEDGERYYTLNEALKHIDEIAENKTGTIAMLIGYNMPASDKLTIPNNYNITLTTANELETPAIILRRPNNLDHMFTNQGTLTFDRITLDGNKGRVTANNAMVLNDGELTLKSKATLQNASGNNGGALYANGGSVNVENGATFTGNQAFNGGAIYLKNGSLSSATNNIIANSATNGGALYMAGGTYELTTSIKDNSAVSGGAVYISDGTLTLNGTISGTATSGGAVFMIGGTLDVVSGGIANGSTAENGGAFYMEGGTLNMSSGTVSDNTATSNGGMLYATGGKVSITNGTVSNNVAQNGNGGAISYTGSGTVVVSGGTLSGNAAENGLGGAIYQSSGEITLSAGNIKESNTAKNGAAIYTAGGITNFKGVSITGNTASEGGAVGMAAGTKLNFSGNTKVSDNSNNNGEKRNVYLNVDSDEIINVPEDLGSNNIGVYVADNVRSTRGEVCCSFGGYVSAKNLAKITDDRDIYTEYEYNNKLYWGKPVKFWVRYLPNGNGFPPNTTSGTQLYGETNYYPKATENQVYTLVNQLYDAYYSDKIKTGYIYAYTYRKGETAFDKYITSIDWDAETRQWVYKLHDGTTYTNNDNAQIVIYYADSAYISIVNNSEYDLTIDPLTVMGKTAVDDGYGYTAVINNVTQRTLLPITDSNLTIPKHCSVRLLFPGAKGSAWSINGVFNATEGSVINYTLDRAGGGTPQVLPTTTTEDGLAFSLNGNMMSTAGGIYEILFGDPTPICKVENSGVEHPFTSLNLAKDYIVANMPTTATIEMLLDYQQPKTDILAIPEGYNITLKTAAAEGSEAAEGKTYTYLGDDPTRATINRSSGDMGAAVTSEIQASTAVLTNDECTTSLTVDGIIFDGKALGQGGEGGAIKTANTKVYIKHCDFKDYTATRGGALYVKWGRLEVENSDFTNCKILSNQDKTGGGGIWTTAHDLRVESCNFINCDCTQYPKNNSTPQAGAIFHNIRYDDAVVHPGDGQKFPTGFSKNSTTQIKGCTFKDCIATGSGGTIESDAWFVDIENSSFRGSQTTKSGGNGGAVNIYTNDNQSINNSTYLNVINCWFEDCSASNGNTNGGAVRTLCKSVKISGTTFKNTFSNNTGGALSMTNTGTKLEIYGCTFDDCRANESSGAVYAKATTLTVGDSESYMDYNAETGKHEVVNGERHTSFTDCTSKKYGGIYHDQTGDATITGATFTRCTTTNESAGALYTKTKKLNIEGTRFVNCTASSDGGAVYNNDKDGSQVLKNCVFDGCTSGTNGGGAYLAAKSLTVSDDTEIKNCVAVNNGGGIYTGTGGTGASFTNSTFTNNRVTASEGKGGALYHNSNGLTFNGGSFEKNCAAYGGGIYHNGSAFTLNSTQISKCSAKLSGGGIYHNNGTFQLKDAQISECYAVTSGGGIFSKNNLYAYGKIENCVAGQGGGIYSDSKLYFTDTENTMTIENCHAKNVTLNEDGTVTVADPFSADNLGGGIYKKSDLFDMTSAKATVKGCFAYDGGGVYYNSGGTLTFSAGSFCGNTAMNNGGAIYKNAGIIKMSGSAVIGGSEENANNAQLGAGIFVADGEKITIGGGSITHNVAEVGGAVAVGGSNSNTQLLFEGAPIIRDNTTSSGDKCNVYLNYDSNGIIRTSGAALTPGAYIGVYVTDAQFNRHGDYGKPFGTFNNSENLSSFYNDRIYAGGKRGSSNNQIVWAEFVCKITDGKGNLLYTDSACEAPAVYAVLENDGAANTTSAFGMLSNAAVNLYYDGDVYSGAYQIQMLVGDYSCTARMSLPAGKDVTLTTADSDSKDGFPYTGVDEVATLFRGGTFNNSWITNRSNLTLKDIAMDGQNKESDDGSGNSGGIVCNKDSGSLTIKANTTLKNSGTKTAGGGAIGLHGNASKLYMEGGLIENCFASNNGGAVFVQNAGAEFHISGGSIVNCSAKNGGAVYAAGKIYMSGGSFTGNRATAEAGGIDLRNEIHFSGNPIISGNTLNGSTPCNLHLINDNNTSIYADDLGPFAEIRVYTSGNIKTKHGEKGMPFGTWTDNANLHCFINDLNTNLRGMKTTDNYLIYWRESAFLTVGKIVDSDWSADKDVEFDFTVKLNGQDDFNGTYGDMAFTNGVATFKLKAGQARTASGLPFDFIHAGVNYTVTENLPEGQTSYTTKYAHNGGEPVDGKSVTGHFGENMGDDPATSSSVSSVEFTNIRNTDDIAVSKSVTDGITGDEVMPYYFTVTLDDKTITKTYNAKRYLDETDTTGVDETVSFDEGVGTFRLVHGQKVIIEGLPTKLGYKVEENLTEDQRANFRTYVKADDAAEEIVAYSREGAIGTLKHVAFRNNRYSIVCKFVNNTDSREQLYFREGNDSIPAIFDELEKAFDAINSGTIFFTADGQAADTALRLEMVKPQYTMKRQAALDNLNLELPEHPYSVTLGTAQKTDHLYPYPTDADDHAVVTRGFNDGSMIKDRGALTIDAIILDGDNRNHTSTENGGIVQVVGAQTLTVTNKATLRNSVSSGDGGAIWIGEKAGLAMNGAIENCQANNGGGIYAVNGFGGGTTNVGVTIGGSVYSCTAENNGGAIYAGEASNSLIGIPVKLTDSATLTGNAASAENGCGGAVYSSAAVEIDSANVSVSGNRAVKDGGGIYLTSDASLTMEGGAIRNNTATSGDGGAIWAQNASINNGVFDGNKAQNGNGGAIYTNTSSIVTITGEDTSFTGNTAKQGGAVYDQAASLSMSAGSMTGNSATEAGGAVYVADNHSFDMLGGSISSNSSPEGAISTSERASLNFSGTASVTGNTASDGSTVMNVYLGYHSNSVINDSGLTDGDPIGVYVADGDSKVIYNNHGIANRPFGAYTGTGDNLNRFVNDRDASLTGVKGLGNLIMWPGKEFSIQVYQNKEDQQGNRTTPVGGAQFSLKNENDVTVWTGYSDSATGLVKIPWGTTESAEGGTATFVKKDGENVAPVTYTLSQERANSDTVRPAGTWEMRIGIDNNVTWETNQSPEEYVNRTLNVENPDSSTPVVGEVFKLYDDVKPRITFNATGGKLENGESSITYTVDFDPTETKHTYTVEEHNPTRESSVFRVWSTVENPVSGDGHLEYVLGDERLFYRVSDDDDVTLYAQWETVVCKITDRNDNLLYVNGSPAVYMSLKAGFDDFNDAVFTIDGQVVTPRKLKMLVPEYKMTENVQLARGKIAEFMTASSKDTDGYAGPEDLSVITRASSFNEGSMITNNYNLVIRDIVLDGALRDSSGNPMPNAIAGNGGIITVVGNASQLTLTEGATLRNASVSGNGGAVYAYGNTTVTVSDGSAITKCHAANGGAVYADNVVASSENKASGTVNVNGGVISGNTAATTEGVEAKGGAIYATGTVNMTGGDVKDNASTTHGGGLYLAGTGTLSMKGGSLSGNSAAYGGGVYSDGSVKLENAYANISGNTASGDGGGVYVSNSGSFTLKSGSIGTSGNPNKAVNGGGVYLAGSGQLNGGSISYNGDESVVNGGGLYLNSVTDVTLNGTQLSYNKAAYGGAVYAVKSSDTENKEITLTLAKGTISNNEASGNGGGVHLGPGMNLRMTGGTLGNGNTADLGGGVYTQGAFELVGGSLTGNTAHNGGGAYVTVDGSMTLAGGTVSKNNATSDGEATGNGAAIYIEGNSEKHGTLSILKGKISENNAATTGGAVYLQNYAQMHAAGGEISGNAASGENGGAVNVDGADARIYLSGNPVIFNNPGSASTTSQKNLVLSVDANGIIGTEGGGLTGGSVGVYVTGAVDDPIYRNHGIYGKPFGTFGDEDANRINAKYLVNDRDLALYGVSKGDNDNTIYWLNVVCKVVNSGDVMLYKQVTVNGTKTRVYTPAVYTTLKEGFAAVGGSLYRRSGSRYATANTGPVKVKMLQDYALDENEIISYARQRNLTLTTAETTKTSAMVSNGDSYVYTPSQGATGESSTKATLTRAQTSRSMFTVNTLKNEFNVSNLIIDGGNNAMLTGENINGGAFNIGVVSSSTFNGVTLKNLNATGNGGAIYLTSGRLSLTNSTLTGNAATSNGGSVYLNSGSLTLTNTNFIGNAATSNGGSVFVGSSANATLNSGILSGNTANANGGAVYVEGNGGKFTVKGGSLGGNDAASGNTASADGGAVYVSAGATATMTGGSVKNNAASNGAGIYVANDGALHLSGSPSFGNNMSATVLSDGSTNGGDSYSAARQDIYLAVPANEAEGQALTSLVLDGNLNVTEGSIWVWASGDDNTQPNHFYMLKQFAILANSFTGTVDDSTYKAFRNARVDADTDCGGEYLTGQPGDNIDSFRCIYWTGGYDFSFLKIDSFGNPLNGAEFKLYSDPACNVPVDRVGAATSANQTSEIYDGTLWSDLAGHDGVVKFEKVATGVYFMKETALDGYRAGDTYVVVVGADNLDLNKLRAKAGSNDYVFQDISQDDLNAQKNAQITETNGDYGEKNYAIFKITNGKADPDTDIVNYGLVNERSTQKKVILKKVDSQFNPLPDAQFEIRNYDGSLRATTDKSERPSGVFWVGDLPLGVSYLKETNAPDGYEVSNENKFFKLQVNADGTQVMSGPMDGPDVVKHVVKTDNATTGGGTTPPPQPTDGSVSISPAGQHEGKYMVDDVVQLVLKVGDDYVSTSDYNAFKVTLTKDGQTLINETDYIYRDNKQGLTFLTSGTITITIEQDRDIWDGSKKIPAGTKASITIDVAKKDSGTTTLSAEIEKGVFVPFTIKYVANVASTENYTDQDVDAILQDGGLKKGFYYTKSQTVYYCYNNLTERDKIKYSSGEGLLVLQDFTFTGNALNYTGTPVNADGSSFSASRGSLVKQGGKYYIACATQNWYDANTNCADLPEWFHQINP